MKPLLSNTDPFKELVLTIKFVSFPVPIKYAQGLELETRPVISSLPIGLIVTLTGLSLGVDT